MEEALFDRNVNESAIDLYTPYTEGWQDARVFSADQ